MNLKSKKELAARALKVGKERIAFVRERSEEIKEAITKQDIKDLVSEGAIKVKEVKGRRTNLRKPNKRRSSGNIRKNAKNKKREYMIMTRKLRAYAGEMEKSGRISKEDVKELRKKIRNRYFRSKAHMKDYIGGLKR